MSDSDTDTYTVSFKTGPGYDASLIVVRGNTAEELAANINALSEQENGPDSSVVELVVDTENLVHTAYAAKAPQAPSTGSQTAQQQDGGAEVRMCSHGKRERREGNKNGRKWVGYFCALPKGASGSCKAEFEDN